MENNAPLLNTDRKVQHGNYAAIPGSGPLGATCSGCALLDPSGSRFICAKFQSLTGRKGKPINTGTAACRYFEMRRPFNLARGE